MPKLDFNKFNYSKTNNTKKEVTVLESKIQAAIYVDKKANYSVKLISTGEVLPLYYKSYKCKDKENIYMRVTPTNNRVCIIRSASDRHECNNLFYLPFAVGHLAIGDIILDNITNKKMFYIKKSTPDKFAKYTDDAFEYYKAHKETIDNIILEKRKGYGNSPY